MIWAANVYRPCEWLLKRQSKAYHVNADHMLIRVFYPPLEGDFPVKIEIGLSVSDARSMHELKRAYSQRLFSSLPWHNDSKPELYGCIGRDTFHHYGHSVLSFERNGRFPVISMMLSRSVRADIRDGLTGVPGVVHSDQGGSELTAALKWMETQHPEVYARYVRNWMT